MAVLRTTALRITTGLLAAVVCLSLISGPASAVYPNQPSPQSWTPPGPVHALLATSKRVYVAGENSSGGGVIAALNASSGKLLWQVATDADVRALAVSKSGKRLFAGGLFLTVDGARHKRLVAMRSRNGSVIGSWKPSTSGAVLDLLVVERKLYIGGSFDAIGLHRQRGLAAVDVGSGRRIKAFKARVNLRVESLAKSGKQLIVAGRFIRVNGKLRASLAAVSLSRGKLTSWSPARVCATCTTYWDVVVDDARAYVASSGPGGNVGAYDLSTGKRSWLVHADGDVQALAIGSGGLLYLGGHFNKFVGSGSTERTLLAAVRRPTGKVNGGFHPKLYKSYPGVWALAATSTRLYAGGSFTGVRSHGANNNEPYLAMFGPSLRGKWSLNETNGAVAHDSSGLGHHGQIYSAQLGEPGKLGLAYGFGANQARIEVPTHPDLNPGSRDFSFSAYLNFSEVPGVGQTYDVVRKGLSFTAGGEYKLEIVHSGSARCIAKDGSGLTARIPARTTSLADGRWHRIGCRLVGSTWSVLVDGQARSRTVPLKKIDNVAALSIGSKYGQQDGTPGRIDEVQLTIG